MTFTSIMTIVWSFLSKVLKSAVGYVEGTEVGKLVLNDIKKLGSLASVYAVELAFVIVPLAGWKSIFYLPLAVLLVLIPNVVAQFKSGS